MTRARDVSRVGGLLLLALAWGPTGVGAQELTEAPERIQTRPRADGRR